MAPTAPDSLISGHGLCVCALVCVLLSAEDLLPHAAHPEVLLVSFFGPPGVGKLTVTRVLASLTGFKLFRNQLAVNLAATVFPHQSPPYFRLIHRSCSGRGGPDRDTLRVYIW